MLWSEIMPSRYVRNHRTRRDRLGNAPPLLLIAPPSAADRARYLRAALNDLRVVTNVDHNVHTILYPKRIAIVHHSPSLSLCGVTAPLTDDRQNAGIGPAANSNNNVRGDRPFDEPFGARLQRSLQLAVFLLEPQRCRERARHFF